ncbi:hypothetical protein DXG01_006633 [Tephrocybe rancida]|nr:hypothetical protein DXG01_006633 [Tephrocybe rancida]
MVLDGAAYSTLLAADSKSSEEVDVEHPNAVHATQSDYHHASPHMPITSIVDLQLNNITYDKILSSSAKGLSLTSQGLPPPTPPFGDDARTPPNSPTSAPSNQSLMAASADIMTSGAVTRSDVDKTAL